MFKEFLFLIVSSLILIGCGKSALVASEASDQSQEQDVETLQVDGGAEVGLSEDVTAQE
jgi:hypothetical protein